jgi:hypothetical protein
VTSLCHNKCRLIDDKFNNVNEVLSQATAVSGQENPRAREKRFYYVVTLGPVFLVSSVRDRTLDVECSSGSRAYNEVARANDKLCVAAHSGR